MVMKLQESLLRVEDAAKILSVSRWTIYRWVEEGRLEATKISRGSLRIFHRSVNSLVETNCVQRGIVMEPRERNRH
ncbi:hypothetical protein YTPLAS18_06200 [Nitrospira sp.]|nr:hypothetical protein YTPLAS18_06200 [Nitrospira sp.]